MDFGLIKKAMDPILAELDHHLLNDVPGLENSTSELIAKYLWERLRPQVPLLSAVTVWESTRPAASTEARRRTRFQQTIIGEQSSSNSGIVPSPRMSLTTLLRVIRRASIMKSSIPSKTSTPFLLYRQVPPGSRRSGALQAKTVHSIQVWPY